MHHSWSLVSCDEGQEMYGVELYAAVRLAVVGEGLSHHEGFTLWLDCAQRGPVVAHYKVGHDTGSIDTKQSFRFDEDHRDWLAC